MPKALPVTHTEDLHHRAGATLADTLEQAAAAVAASDFTTVARLRTAAELLDEDVWIAVRLPGGYEGADELDDGAAVQRWTTVVTHPDELGWLREALQLLAGDDQGEEDDLEPQ